MNEFKSTITDAQKVAQKVAQKKYDQKTKMVSIKYTPVDMSEYRKLKNYLDESNQSANSFIKDLIKNFFENIGKNRMLLNWNENEKKQNEPFEYFPYSYIEAENLQFLRDTFGEKTTNKILDEFIVDKYEFEVNDLVEQNGCNFDTWVDEIKARMVDGEFQSGTKEEICEKLVEDLNHNF